MRGVLDSRSWSGPDDLRAMSALLSATWAGPHRPFVTATPGDLEWWQALGGPRVDWSARIRIWTLAGQDVAWAWFKPPATIEWFVQPGLESAIFETVFDEILEWHRLAALLDLRDRVSDLAERAVDPAELDADPTRPLELWAVDDWPAMPDLAARGWTATDTRLTQYVQPLEFELDRPRVPDGYVLRSLRGPEDVEARVDVHRAAFAPSQLTVEKYEIATHGAHYAFERDVVLEAADGSFAAFALGWADPVGSVGELEPVGVHPDHQRRGLGRVVVREALRRLRAAGLRDAIVFSSRTNTASEALYRSAGFDEVAIHRLYTKPIP